MRVKIFGERNTGTNVLKQLIEANSASAVQPGTVAENSQAAAAEVRAMRAAGASRPEREAWMDAFFWREPPPNQWKHCAPDFDDLSMLLDLHVVVTVRHPLSWLLSLHRNRQDRLAEPPDDFGDFLRHDWRLLRRDRLDAVALTPPALYAAKLSAQRRLVERLRAAGGGATVLRFETIATDQAAAFEALRPHLDAPAARPREIARSTKAEPKDAAFYRDRYISERWRDELPEGIDGLARIDPDLLAWAGYAP